VVGVRWKRYMCTLRKTCFIHVSWIWTSQAIYLFQVTPCSPCGTILFRPKLICSKRMRKLVSIHSFYIRWRIHCIWNHAQMLTSFPYGRTQHVRQTHSSIVSVIHYVSMWYFMSRHVTMDGSYFSGSATCPFLLRKWNVTVAVLLLELHTGRFNKYHLLFSIYNSVFVRVQMYYFSLMACLFLALIASVRETKKFPSWWL